MVVLGQWPYQHSITLDQLRRQSGVRIYYYVDDDKMVSHNKALELERNGYIIDDTYMTIMSEDKHIYVQAYIRQNFPPTPPIEIQELIDDQSNDLYRDIDNKISESGAVMIVNGQENDLMYDIGAVWNSHLGLWIIDSTALRLLREKRREDTGGTIQMRQDKGGVLVEIRGDVSAHVNTLLDAGGKYDEKNDVWYIPMASVHKVMHIVS